MLSAQGPGSAESAPDRPHRVDAQKRAGLNFLFIHRENTMKIRLFAAQLTAALLLALGTGAQAAEIKVLSSNAVKSLLEELAPQIEKATNNKIAFTFDTAAALKGQIEKGAAFDLAVLTDAGIDDLIKQGKISGATRTALARSGAGVAIKKGAPKPDIRTTEAFKRTLLAAKSIGFVEQGATGIYLKGLFQRLGIADELKPKLKMLPAELGAGGAVAKGEVEIGLTQIAEILPYAGAELLGPLPAEIQLNTDFASGVATGAKEAAGANALIKFLATPAAVAVIKAKGLVPR
jgi:molybdate transport system substrate-binding protein